MRTTKAILLVTGTELSGGETHDLNGPFLARELTDLGVRVERILLLPDDPELLADMLRWAMSRAELVISSGGLGPTADDHMTRVVAAVYERDIVRHPAAERRMRQLALRRFGAEHCIPDNFFKQAEVVTGADVLLNSQGLAPGMILATERGFLAVLPGVPRELEAMYREFVRPRICEQFDIERPRILRAKILGVPESWAEARIQALGLDFERLEYGISARPGDLTIRLVARSPDDFSLIDLAREKLEKEFADDFVALTERVAAPEGGTGKRQAVPRTHSRVVHEALLDGERTVATAESCTGGEIAAELTQHPGASEYFLGGIVVYADEAKEKLLGVPKLLLERHGAVSEPVCGAMAAGVLERLGADLAVSTTGIAGPTGGSARKPLGLVYVGLALRDARGAAPEVRVDRHEFSGGRSAVRSQAVVTALELLRRQSMGKGRRGES